ARATVTLTSSGGWRPARSLDTSDVRHAADEHPIYLLHSSRLASATDTTWCVYRAWNSDGAHLFPGPAHGPRASPASLLPAHHPRRPEIRRSRRRHDRHRG